MTKEMFMDCMLTYKKHQDLQNKLADLGLNCWELKEVAELESNYIMMICEMCHDYIPEDDPFDVTWIDYFIYELDWGQDWKEGDVVDEDGNNIKLATLDDLWDYLVKLHPEIKSDTDNWYY